MKTLIVYFSKFGHTLRIAEAMAAALRASGDVRLCPADQLDPAELPAYDLVIMGSPTHNMNLPVAVRPILAALPRGLLDHRAVAAFDTSYKLSWWLRPFTAAKRLNRILRKLGGRPVVPPETFQVMEREGPLYEGEMDRAHGWASSLAGRLIAAPA